MTTKGGVVLSAHFHLWVYGTTDAPYLGTDVRPQINEFGQERLSHRKVRECVDILRKRARYLANQIHMDAPALPKWFAAVPTL